MTVKQKEAIVSVVWNGLVIAGGIAAGMWLYKKFNTQSHAKQENEH